MLYQLFFLVTLGNWAIQWFTADFSFKFSTLDLQIFQLGLYVDSGTVTLFGLRFSYPKQSFRISKKSKLV